MVDRDGGLGRWGFTASSGTARAGVRGCLALVAMLMLAGIPAALPARAAGDDSASPPYWASLKADEVNMRVGPGEDYRILWVYHRAHLPVKVRRELTGWRLVEDKDGARGWVNQHFLSREANGMIIGTAPTAMRAAPREDAALRWRLAPGVIGKLGACADGWCRLDVVGQVGYVPKAAIWGAGAP